MRRLIIVFILVLPTLLLTGAVHAAEPAREPIKGLDEQVQEVKEDVLGLAVELNQLEEQLLYPSNTELAIFVCLAKGTTLRPDSLEIRLGGRPVATHLYTFKELQALQKGGVQRLYTGNLRTGDHPLEVTVLARSQGGTDLRRSERFTLHKDVGPKIVELALTGEAITLREL